MLKDLAIYLRFKQLFAHNCHNLVSKPTFFSDHEFLGELYSQAEGWYDGTVERMIGLGQEVDLIALQIEAVDYLKGAKYNAEDNQACFQILLNITKEILAEIEKLGKSGKLTQGTIQWIGDIANAEESNVYKLKRRLKG